MIHKNHIKKFDYCIIGAGIIGLSTAYALINKIPRAKILIIDKEKSSAEHQTSRNSGVIHAGIYYEPGSLKAELCKEGLNLTKEFCNKYKVPYVECGKLIVATRDDELSRLQSLHDRASKNGLSLAHISAKKLKIIEPNIHGIEALLSPKTSIVDYKLIASRLVDILSTNGVTFIFGETITNINEHDQHVEIQSANIRFESDFLVACAGLQSDRIAKLANLDIDFKIIPFRGEYFMLPRSMDSIVRHLIYPVPNPELPFLGIHLTKMIDGSVTVGPNAALGFAREGYPKWSVSIKDSIDMLKFSGFWKLISRYRGYAFHEALNSLSKQVYLRDCKKYCPELTIDSLLPYRPGIRAQAVSRNGELIHDFIFEQTKRMLHVCNAPSPAATSALPIGRMIAKRILG